MNSSTCIFQNGKTSFSSLLVLKIPLNVIKFENFQNATKSCQFVSYHHEYCLNITCMYTIAAEGTFHCVYKQFVDIFNI